MREPAGRSSFAPSRRAGSSADDVRFGGRGSGGFLLLGFERGALLGGELALVLDQERLEVRRRAPRPSSRPPRPARTRLIGGLGGRLFSRSFFGLRFLGGDLLGGSRISGRCLFRRRFLGGCLLGGSLGDGLLGRSLLRRSGLLLGLGRCLLLGSGWLLDGRVFLRACALVLRGVVAQVLISSGFGC